MKAFGVPVLHEPKCSHTPLGWRIHQPDYTGGACLLDPASDAFQAIA